MGVCAGPFPDGLSRPSRTLRTTMTYLDISDNNLRSVSSLMVALLTLCCLSSRLRGALSGSGHHVGATCKEHCRGRDRGHLCVSLAVFKLTVPDSPES